jgi:hypothetical protein
MLNAEFGLMKASLPSIRNPNSAFSNRKSLAAVAAREYAYGANVEKNLSLPRSDNKEEVPT